MLCHNMVARLKREILPAFVITGNYWVRVVVVVGVVIAW